MDLQGSLSPYAGILARMKLLFASFLAFLLPTFAGAEPVNTGHVMAELVSEKLSAPAGGEVYLGVRLEHTPHWHTYWQFPGDSGLPTKFKWALPPGWKIGEAIWPLPERIHLPPLVNFGYNDEALIVFRAEAPAGFTGSAELKVDAAWLVCKEECIPEKASLSLTLPAATGAPKPGPLATVFATVLKEAPRPLPPGAFQSIKVEGKRIGLQLDDDPPWIRGRKLDLFPLEGQLITGVAPPKKEGRKGELTLWADKADPFSRTAQAFRGVLVVGEKKEREAFLVEAPLVAEGAGANAAIAADASAPPAAPGAPGSPPPPADAEAASLWVSALFAFLGGVLLNLMPCVFPVLGIKVMALVSQSDGDKWHARKHGKIYTLGVLVSFWALTAALLGLRSAGQAVGWGFQLQQPGFVLILIFLFTLISANLLGAFEFGGRWVGLGSNLAGREGYSGSFFTGMLAVVVATPCTAPFMGTAIGVVLAQPAWAVFAVFSALAIGLAFPFLVLAYQPKLLKAMPRPGAWMENLKEFFAFPMAATVLWLLWVLGQQKGLDAAIGTAGAVLLLCMGFWAWHRFPGRAAHAGAGLMFALSAGAAFGVLTLPTVSMHHLTEGGPWKAYSEEALNEARASGQPVFVDFTAAWCLTCQVNKTVVLDKEDTQSFFREKNAHLLLADWTNSDPAITAALEKQGRIGVPLYLVYLPGQEKPRVLPQILTAENVRAAFN